MQNPRACYNWRMSLMVDNSKTYLREMEASEVQKDFWPRVGKLSAFLWRQGQTKPFDLKSVIAVRENTIKILPTDEYHQKTLIADFPGLNVFMKFKASEELQFFVSGQFALDENGKDFIIHLQAPFFVTTKRSACRYLTTKMDRISLTVAGHTFSCFDISSGGFSTEVKKDQYGGLTKGSSFEDVDLKYNFKSFKIPTVKLVNIIDVIGHPDKVRLAFKFEQMKPKEEDALWVEVNNSVKKLVDLMGQ